MRFYETPVPLQFEAGQHEFERKHSEFYEGREFSDRSRRFLSRKDEVSHDALHPGRAGLVRGRDYDVVAPQAQEVPAQTVQDVILIDARTRRNLVRVFDQFGHRFPFVVVPNSANKLRLPGLCAISRKARTHPWLSENGADTARASRRGRSGNLRASHRRASAYSGLLR